MKLRPGQIFGILIYIICFTFFYIKYVPWIKTFQVILIPILLIVIVLTSISIKIGSLALIFLIPTINSFPYFMNLKGINPLLFIFLGYFMGFLIHCIFRPFNFKFNFKNPILIPLIGALSLIIISGIITFFRYSNFFPISDTAIYELTINVINVKAGEAIRRVIFDSLNYISGFLWFLILVNVLKSRQLTKKAFISLSIGTCISIIFGFYQFLINPAFGNLEFWVKIKRINALFSDPNAFGVFLAMCTPLFLGALFILKKAWKVPLIFSILGGIFLLPHIGSRSGFLGVALSLLFFFFFLFKIIIDYQKKNPQLFKKSLIYLLVSLLIIGLISSIFMVSKSTTLHKRLKWNLQVLSKEGAWQRISQGRYYFWKASYFMIKENPFSGTGIGSFTCELPNYYKKYNIYSVMPFNYYEKVSSFRIPIDTAGNLYLQIASEFGIIGFLFFVWIFYLIIKQIYLINFKQKLESGWNYLFAGISAGILSLLIIFLFGAHTLNLEIQLTFWLLVSFLFVNSKPMEISKKKKFLIKIIFILILIIYSVIYLWNSTHTLSLHTRTREFNLKQNFGFYKKEKMDSHEFRWTGKNAGISIKIKKPILIIPILASHPDIRENPVKMKIFLIKDLFKQKKLIDKIILKESKWQEFKYNLSDEIGSEVMLLFKVNRTWQPLRVLGTPDPRNLGVAVGEIKFEGPSNLKIEQIKLIQRFSRSEWKGPLGPNLYSNNQCWIGADLPKGNFIFKICARGTKAKEEWPYMMVKINNKIIGGEWVESYDWKYYSFRSKLEKGKYKIYVAFINDYYDRQLGEDRNLYIGELKIYQILKLK